MNPIINLPSDFATTTLAYVSQIFSDLSPVIILVIGVLLALVAVEILLGIFRHK